jgi:hypothetical protein
MRGFAVVAVLVALITGCGEHGQPHSWRQSLASPAELPHAEVSELAYPPFSKGIFPCSRCHEGGPQTEPETPPARFAHSIHIEEGLACADCHMADGGQDPAPANVEFCLECHDTPAEGSDGVRAYFASIQTGDGAYAIPSRWASDELRTHHPAHATAGVACEQCHGNPGVGVIAKPRSVPMMNGCIECHTERKVDTKCETCHTRIREPQHKAIVLHHAEEQRTCLGCHNPDDRDTLRLASGKTLAFEESYLLCGQCHGPKLRDWRLGLHGKRTGEWNGKRTYLLCVHCHSPHQPGFPPMHAMQRPARPEEIR